MRPGPKTLYPTRLYVSIHSVVRVSFEHHHCRLIKGIIAEKSICESTCKSHGAIIEESSVKSLKNLCYGKEFLPHFGHFIMFMERSNGARTPHFVREGPIFKSTI